jgi:SAM-dependent methyltransferase
MNDHALLGAYLLYFWPVSYEQVKYCLAQAGFTRSHPPLRALDIGAGPGPASCLLFDIGARDVTAVDRSMPALQVARGLANERAWRLPVEIWDGETKQPIPQAIRPYDCIVASHLLNELWSGADDRIARRVELLKRIMASVKHSGALVVIDPALRSTTRDLLAVRDQLIEKGFTVQAPCFTAQPCPALADPESTCHVSIRFRSPPLLDEIAQSVGPHREALRMSYLVVRHPPETPATAAGDTFRVVSEPLTNKAGRLRVLLCGPTGRVSLSADPREKHPACAILQKLQRGTVVRVSGFDQRGEGMGVTAATRIEQIRSQV